MNKFYDLKVWQEAHKLVLMVHSTVLLFPDYEKFGMSNQMRRASQSITNNIAEGFGRTSRLDKRNFYIMAHGSLTEVLNQIIISRDLGYVSTDTAQVYCSSKLYRAFITGLN